MKYNIGSNMVARINFDEVIAQDIEQSECDDFDAWWSIACEQYETDDPEEAHARALHVWKRVR